jgi:hypothetical protein
VDILIILDEINDAYGGHIRPSDFSRDDFRSAMDIFDLIQRPKEK